MKKNLEITSRSKAISVLKPCVYFVKIYRIRKTVYSTVKFIELQQNKHTVLKLRWNENSYATAWRFWPHCESFLQIFQIMQACMFKPCSFLNVPVMDNLLSSWSLTFLTPFWSITQPSNKIEIGTILQSFILWKK